MRTFAIRSIDSPCTRPRGFTLIELMVAVTIGLFLVGGLLTLVQALKSTTATQNAMSQLQDNERMAMQLITDVVQSSGYFVAPLSNSAQTAFPAVGQYSYSGPPAGKTDTFASSGQTLAGTYAASTPGGDTITARYMTNGLPKNGGSDNVINCTGNTNNAGAAVTFINTFSVVNGNLQCFVVTISGGNAVMSPPITLMSGIYSMSVLYGVQTNTTVSNGSADTYLNAHDVSIGNYWGAVKSVKVTLQFVNPMWGTLAGQTESGNTLQYVPFTRVITVMSNTGVTITG
jgi:type IV pilus assembly protein PilW